MKNNSLNPFNDPEIAELLKKSADDQLWYFLDDCVPTTKKDVALVVLKTFDPDVINEEGHVSIHGTPYCALVTDMIFEKSEKELLMRPMTQPYQKYFAIQKACYKPYFTECYLLDAYDDLTEGQQKFLNELQGGSVWGVSLQKPEYDEPVKVAMTFSGCGRHIAKEGWLVRVSDAKLG